MAEINILLNILTKMKAAHPTSSFINSLYNQYCVQGGLSKKQMEGLLDKAKKTPQIPQGNIATLEALILKKITRERAAPTLKATQPPQKDEETGKLLQEILEKYPQHKRVLFIQSKYNKNEAITVLEIEEVKKFYKMLVK
ncbi:MAG: hypothetical protein IPP48_09040 [Chitinophagaceae bacterium]|nr:hypothetical protein [Chitinophagaceae bacterium]